LAKNLASFFLTFLYQSAPRHALPFNLALTTWPSQTKPLPCCSLAPFWTPPIAFQNTSLLIC